MEVSASVATEQYLVARGHDGKALYGLRFLIVVEHEDSRRWISNDWTTDFSVACQLADHANLGLSMGLDLDPRMWRLDALPTEAVAAMAPVGQSTPLYS